MSTASSTTDWETLASAGATIATTVATIAAEDLGSLRFASKNLEALAGWYKALVALPSGLWWLATCLVAGALFYAGLRLRKRWGTPTLFIAPAVMLVLCYLLPWLLFAPIRALTPAAS